MRPARAGPFKHRAPRADDVRPRAGPCVGPCTAPRPSSSRWMAPPPGMRCVLNHPRIAGVVEIKAGRHRSRSRSERSEPQTRTICHFMRSTRSIAAARLHNAPKPAVPQPWVRTGESPCDLQFSCVPSAELATTPPRADEVRLPLGAMRAVCRWRAQRQEAAPGPPSYSEYRGAAVHGPGVGSGRRHRAASRVLESDGDPQLRCGVSTVGGISSPTADGLLTAGPPPA